MSNGMNDDQQPEFPVANPQVEEQNRHWLLRPEHRRPVLAAATALAVVVTVAGAAKADNSPVAALLSTSGSTSYLTTNSATVASSVTGALVDIVSTEGYQNAKAAGTGMILTSTGEILTNNHVIDGATSIKVTVISTGRTYTASVVGTDPTQDVAVLQLAGASGLKTLPIGDSSAVKVGQKVTARGNAGGVGGQPSVVSGTVTGVGKQITASDDGANAEQLTGLIETNAPIVAGDSGGALATSSGRVIGMDTAAAATNGTGESTTSDAYAIPIRTALTIAHEIETGQASSTIEVGRHGFLGVELQEDSTSGSSTGSTGGYGSSGGYGGGYGYGRAFGGYGGFGYGGGGFGSTDGGLGTGTATSGAVVAGVVDSGPVASLGLSAGDVITSVNGKAVTSASTLNTIMAGTRPGQKVTLGWTDTSGQSQSATVTLGTAAAD